MCSGGVGSEARAEGCLNMILRVKRCRCCIPVSSPGSSSCRVTKTGGIVGGDVIPVVQVMMGGGSNRGRLGNALEVDRVVPMPASRLRLCSLRGRSSDACGSLIRGRVVFVHGRHRGVVSGTGIVCGRGMSGSAATKCIGSTLSFRTLRILYSGCRAVSSDLCPMMWGDE